MTDDLYAVGNRIEFRNVEGVKFLGKITRISAATSDFPEFVEVKLDGKGVFNIIKDRMVDVRRRYFERDEFDIAPSETITVGELKSRLARLPDDVILQTEMYDYYVDLLSIAETGEVIWKP